jgi:hypothetical protein
MNHENWIAHFKRNKENRPEPDWAAPSNLPPGVLAPMLKSIEQFRLGDGGGPGDAKVFSSRIQVLNRKPLEKIL